MVVAWKKLAYEDDVVLEADFAATTFLYATSDNTPQAKTPAEVMAILSGSAAAEFLLNTQKIGGVVDPTTNQQVATKKYVDDTILTSNEFTELTDTPASYTSAADKIVSVNSTPDALEFITPAALAAKMALDDIGVPDAGVDFDLQQAIDLVVFTVADETARDALIAGATEVGQLIFATTEKSLSICVESAV